MDENTLNDNEAVVIEEISVVEEKPRKEYKPNPLLLPISIIIAGALIAGALIFNARSAQNQIITSTSATPTPTQSAVSTSTVTVSIKGSNYEGSKNAKVAVVEFSDYQCPYCKNLYTTTIPQIRSNYVQKNKVLHVFENFPLTQIHPLAMIGAEAALCAGEQNKYWEMHDTIYNSDQSNNDQAKLEQYASDLGLDTTKFNNCLTQNTYKDVISTEQDRGNKISVQGTPTVVVGKVDYKNMTVTGNVIFGAYPFDTFQPVIEKYLKQ